MSFRINEALLKFRAKLGSSGVLKAGTLLAYENGALVEAGGHLQPEAILLTVGFPGQIVDVCMQAAVNFGENQYMTPGDRLYWSALDGYNFSGQGFWVGRVVNFTEVIIAPLSYAPNLLPAMFPAMSLPHVPPVPAQIAEDASGWPATGEVALEEPDDHPKRYTKANRKLQVQGA